jgi:hypothetical protein
LRLMLMPKKPVKYLWFAMVAGMHVLLASLLINAHIGPVGAPEAKGMVYAELAEVSEQAAPPATPPQVLHNPLEPFDPDIAEPEITIAPPAPIGLLNPLIDFSEAKKSPPCDATPFLVEAFLQEPKTQAALQILRLAQPNDSKIIGLWNGAWIVPEAQNLLPAYNFLQNYLIKALKTVPEPCLMQENQGIRIVIIPYSRGDLGEDASLGFVVGAAKWRWAMLIDDAL